MTYVAPVFELSILGIFDSGVPNRERIVLRPMQAVDLSLFGLLIGSKTDVGTAPWADHFLWLGPQIISPPSWLVIYTGTGVDTETKDDRTGEPVLIKYWGRNNTLFNSTTFPIMLGLFKFGGFVAWESPKPAPALPQFPG